MTQDEQLTVDLWLLDALLTGRDPRSGRGDEDKLVSIETFVCGQMFYLSDGGYSRVFYSESEGALRLSSESRKDVHELWFNRGPDQIRRRIVGRIKQWIKQQE